jgi:nucleolar GTP-binding protein
VFTVPTVPTAQEILDKAFRRAKKARAQGENALERAKALSISRLEAFCITIRTSLRKVYESFPSMEGLPEFYRELIDILAGAEEARRSLASLRWAYTKIGDIQRQARVSIMRSKNRGAVDKARKACYGRVSSILHELEPALRFLNELRNTLRKLPSVDPDLPTVVVAGSPNVGKSQLVRAMSTGRPRVAAYPFTTLDLSLGHFTVDYTRLQIMDTPGLLDRPLGERNEVERKALVALRHLADVIILLLDPTETCGYPMEQQEALLEDLKEAFPDTPILEVENKADLGRGTGKRMQISSLTGEGVDELVEEVMRLLTSPSPGGEPPQEAG